MKTNTYKILFYTSLVCNIVLIALLFKPLPKQEQDLVNLFRDVKENQSAILPESKSNEIKHVSNQIIIKISQNWDVESMRFLFSAEVFNQIGEEKLLQILKMYSRLGSFKEHLLPESVETVPGHPNLMLYGTNVKFQNGVGYVRLVLEKIDNDWYLNRININSDVFLN